MTNNKYLYVSLVSAIIFLTMHYLGLRFHLYWKYDWYDIPMHIIGGFWLSLFGLWASVRFGHIDSIVKYKSKAFFIALISAIIIGVFWEAFELVAGITSTGEQRYIRDFSSDVFFTMIGGASAYFYFIKRKICLIGMDCGLMTDRKL